MSSEIEDLSIQNMDSNDEIRKIIYTIRGKQVILDSDIARLYEVETKKLNQAVKRNINRFPEYFCFQLRENEFESLRSQFVTLKIQGRGQHRKYLPYAFTEQGVAMLFAVLHSAKSIEISIKIINAFIEMRKFLNSNGQVFERLTNVEYKLIEHEKKFDKVFNQLQQEESIKQKIFFQGQIWDSYSLIIDNKELYHCGASIKDLGKKCFGINKIEDISIINKLYNI